MKLKVVGPYQVAVGDKLYTEADGAFEVPDKDSEALLRWDFVEKAAAAKAVAKPAEHKAVMSSPNKAQTVTKTQLKKS